MQYSDLVPDKDTLKRYVSASNSIEAADLQTHFETAFVAHVEPFLTTEEFDAISKDSSVKPVVQLIDAIRGATACLAFHAFLPEIKVGEIAAKGLVAPEKQATQADKDELSAVYLRRGFDYIERMLRVLEANKDAFPRWAAAAAGGETLFRSATQFDQVKPINGSRLFFLRIRPGITSAKNQVATWLPASLRTLLTGGTPAAPADDLRKQLLEEYLMPAIAALTLARTSWSIGGAKSDYSSVAVIEGLVPRSKAEESMLKNVTLVYSKEALRQEVNDWMQQVDAFLQANAEALQLPIDNSRIEKIRNDPEWSAFYF